MRTLISAATLLLALTACGGGEDEPSAGPTSNTPAPSETSESVEEEPVVEPNATYGSVTDLRDAMVKLGYACPGWVQDDVLTYASSSGHCSDDDVFSVYLDAADLKSQVEALRQFGAFDENEFGGPMLAGPNWLLNIEDIEAYRSEIGGTIIAN